MEKSLFGQIAIAQGWIDQPTLERCLNRQQSHPGQHIALGQILVRQGLLTQKQVEEILKIQRKLRASHVIEGYELLTKIASGGMGTVYKARKKGIDKIVALKILSPSLARNKSYIERFFREARTAGMLNHPNIVGGFDVGESAGYYYFAMEYAEGETAGRVLAREGKLPETLALDIIRQVTVALDYAMKYGLIHRDIKPGNIIMTADGTVKLSDLGLAKVDAHDTTITQEGRSLCSPQYSSPEQARGDQDIDTRSDIYSLGVTLYQLVTGRVPFDAPTPAAVLAKQITEELPPLREMKQEMSEPLARLIRKAMEKNRDKRFASPAELIAAIDSTRLALAGKRTVASKQSRTPWLPIGLGAAAAVVAIVVAISYLNKPQKEQQPQPQQQVEVGQVDENPPQPAEVDPATKRAEAAQKDLQQVLDYQKKHPDDYEKLLSAFQIVIEGYGGTQAAAEAEAQREALLAARKAVADEALHDANAKAVELADDARFAEAIAALQKLKGGPYAEILGDRIDEQIEQLQKSADEKFAQVAQNAEKLAAAGDFDAARELLAGTAKKIGLDPIQKEADRHLQQLAEQQKQYQQQILAEKQREAGYRLKIYNLNDLVAAFKFDNARQEYDKLQADCPRDLKEFVQSRRADLDLLEELRGKIVESVNGRPNIGLHITLQSGRRISSESASASDSGLKLKIRGAELTFNWDQLSPDSLYSLAKSSVPDQQIMLAVLAHYTGDDDAANKHLEKAADDPTTRKKAQELLARFARARQFKHASEFQQMLTAAADLLKKDQPDDAKSLLLELQQKVEHSPYGEAFAGQVADMLAQADDTLAEHEVQKALEQAELGNWKVVSQILTRLKESFGDTRTVKQTRAADIAELEFKAQRLVIDRRLIVGLHHFMRLEDAAARAVFASLVRENQGVTAKDAQAFLDALDLEVNIPEEADCSELAATLKRVPDPWQRIMAYRSFHRRCRGSSWEAHARARIALIFLNELNRPMIAREVYQLQLKDFQKYSQWCAAAYTGMGRCEDAVGNWEDAEKDFDTVPKNYPDEQVQCAAAMHEKAKHYLKNGETETAVSLLEQAVKKYPLGDNETSLAQLTLADTYRDQLHDKAQALKAYREVYFRTPQNSYITPLAMMSAADILREDGKNAEAERLYRSIIEEFPTSEFATKARGKL